MVIDGTTILTNNDTEISPINKAIILRVNNHIIGLTIDDIIGEFNVSMNQCSKNDTLSKFSKYTIGVFNNNITLLSLNLIFNDVVESLQNTEMQL